MIFRLFYNFFHIFRLSIILCLLSASESKAGRRLKISLLPNGTDEFILTDIKGRRIQCATEGQNFCAEHGAKSVEVNGTCPQNQETLYCRCNSTKPTFSLQKEKCVKDLDIVRAVLRERNSAGCKFRIVVGAGIATRRCLKSTIPTLTTNSSYTQRYSICSTHALNDVVRCTIDGNNSFYLNKEGRWRGLWKLEPREGATGFHGEKLEYVFRELSSARYSGLIVSLQATCLLYRVRGLRLRGQRPPKQIRSCVLLKIAGSRLWSIEPHQMNFTQPNTLNTNLTNQTNHQLREHHVMPRITSTTSTLSTTLLMATTLSAADEPAGTQAAEIHRVKIVGPSKQLLVVVAAVLSFFLVLVVTCLLVVALISRRRRRKTKRREPSTGNPTYERGPDNSLALTTMTAVSHLESSLSASTSNTHVVYQPLVENTRPRGENGREKLYESLDSFRECRLPTRGCFSEFSYQEPIRWKSKTSFLNHTYQTLRPGSEKSSRSLQRSQSESTLNTGLTGLSGLFAQPGLEMAYFKRPRFCSDSEKSNVEDHGQFGVIGMCPSKSLSSFLYDNEAAVGIELKSSSGESSSQDSKGGACLQSFHGKETPPRFSNNDELLQEETGDWKVEVGPEKGMNTAASSCSSFSIEVVQTQGSSHPESDTTHDRLHDASSKTAQTESPSAPETSATYGVFHDGLTENMNTRSPVLTQESVSPSPTQNDAIHDSVYDSTNNSRLDGLVVDVLPESECREFRDSKSDQSEVFYYELEGAYCTCAK